MKDINVYNEERVISGADFTMNASLDHFNERLKVEDYRGNVYSIHNEITNLLNDYPFTKIIIKSRQEDWSTFLSYGYQVEAIFQGYFNGNDAYGMAMYKENARRTSEHWMIEDDTLHQVQKLSCTLESPEASGYIFRKACMDDAQGLAKLYQAVFEIYPTPMNDPTFISRLIQGDSIFYLTEYEGQIVSAASAEINMTYHNAEITDCATLPAHRKNGLMKVLIAKLEEDLKENSIYCTYSIARALSFGMNAVFQQRKYTYTGRFTKNCKIFNKLEDMNLWVCDLSIRKA
ncbi:putative beta-lysine N-acetyltransferase [Pseudalkalibacillus decolorationis]|uniref:putative beta-lysine N-acetyltransferase n=1 Tax=Pseudalkalibacillus decolorationis TaxID=163879 RepID=UPI00214991E5|nr:putative beta-lysine N-acetyltransferase [Pseudalkalibacillus decolorationis]